MQRLATDNQLFSLLMWHIGRKRFFLSYFYCFIFCPGLARKEDFAYITYYCPHCHALNRPKELEEHVSGSVSDSPNLSSLTTDLMNNAGSPLSESVRPSNSPVTEGSEIEEAEKVD